MCVGVIHCVLLTVYLCTSKVCSWVLRSMNWPCTIRSTGIIMWWQHLWSFFSRCFALLPLNSWTRSSHVAKSHTPAFSEKRQSAVHAVAASLSLLVNIAICNIACGHATIVWSVVFVTLLSGKASYEKSILCIDYISDFNK